MKRILPRIGTGAGLVAVALVFLVPLYWLVRSSLMPNEQIVAWPPKLIPTEFTLENFARALELAPFGQFALNSVIVAGTSTLLNVAIAVCTAYAFAFLDFPFKRALFLFMLGALMVPGHVTLLVNYITISNLGLLNTYAGLILPGVANAMATFLLRQHFLGIAPEVLEAAELDGAGHLRRLWAFVLPMSRPIVITVAVTTLIGEWNGFVWPLIATNTVEMRTMPIGLMYLRSVDGFEEWGPIMAGTLLVALPMLLAFLFAQRHIVAGFAGATTLRR